MATLLDELGMIVQEGRRAALRPDVIISSAFHPMRPKI